MRKIVCFVAGLLILSGFAAISIGEEAGDQQETINLSFSNIEITDSNKEPYIEINIDGAGGRLYQHNAPILPLHTTKRTLPFGTKITNIECQTGQVQSMEINEKIVPAPKPAITGIDDPSNGEYIMDETIYNSNELFPNDWIQYYTGGGRDENLEHKTFLNLRVFPVRYSPGTNTVHYITNIEVTINYELPDSNPFPSTTEYDMVIIAPSTFQSSLQKLVTHKNDMGVKTTLKNTEEIYSEYTGYDKPEEIKLFIKDAIETWNIKYVLLVGGLKSLLTGSPRDNINEGTKDWHVPVRYANCKEQGSTHDPGLISELYYADIYDGDGAFDDWDSNDDHIYAKWWPSPGGKDTLDFYPDVSLGRLACRSTTEVDIMVNKIINYEKGARGTSWSDKIILIGGDSFDDTGTNYAEGEVVANKIWADYMTEFTPVKLYASNKISNPSMTCEGTNIKREITKGAGHVFFDGHANPASWTTHWIGEFKGRDSWTERFMIFDMPWLFNFGKTPVCNVEGCHNSQFNVTLFYTLGDRDNSKASWCYGMPVPECWSWWLARKIGGGSISTLGNTGLGYGAVGEHGDLDGDGILEPDICEKLGGFYFLMVYEAFDEGYDMLGDAWAMAHTKYLDVHPGMDYFVDAKEMEELCLLGDPSLKVGGYPTVGFDAEILDAAAGVIGAPSEEVILQAAAYNGEEPYTYEWDFDNDGVYDDADGEIASWTWSIPGVRWISLKASDNNGEVDIFDTIVGIEFGASTPSKPSGETKIKANKPYTYETTINTQGGYWNHLYYKFDWGDEKETEWIESSKATHTWYETGTYKIKVKAMLTHESSKAGPEDAEDFKESDWSNPLTITVTSGRSRQIFNHPLIQLLQKFFENYPNAFPILQQLLGM
jgi:hypothetical protein